MSTVTSIKHFTRGSSYCYKAQKKGTFKKIFKGYYCLCWKYDRLNKTVKGFIGEFGKLAEYKITTALKYSEN